MMGGEMPDLASVMSDWGGPGSHSLFPVRTEALPTPADAIEQHLHGPRGIRWREYTPAQRAFMDSPAKRRIVRAGRRGGKTTGVAGLAVREFLAGKRVLYGGPTMDQLERFWSEVQWILDAPLTARRYAVHQGRHAIWVPGTDQRIRAKTVWIPDDIRGDYADILILDEFQMQAESTWETVGQPMLIDNDGTAIFAFTVPSLISRSASKATDKLHASKLYRRYAEAEEPDPDWACFTFTSHDNPHLESAALERMRRDMSSLAYRQEILAEDPDEVPGALWTRKLIDATRVDREPEDLAKVVVGVDPPGGATECGIVTAAVAHEGDDLHVYVLADASLEASPAKWSAEVLGQYDGWEADRIVAEINYGGDMVESTIRTERRDASISTVRASRGKAIRADPVVALYEQGLVHHVGEFPALEQEMCEWIPGERNQSSPNRLDALVWAVWFLALRKRRKLRWGHSEGAKIRDRLRGDNRMRSG